VAEIKGEDDINGEDVLGNAFIFLLIDMDEEED
jgi:hypothetical protein